MDLVDLGGAQNHGRHILVARRPRQRQLADGATQLLGDGGQLADLCDLGLALLRLQGFLRVAEEVLVGREAGVGRDAVVVLAREQAAGEGRPDGGAVAELLEEGLELDLEALTVEGVVLGLLGDRRDQVVLLGQAGGFRAAECQNPVPRSRRTCFAISKKTVDM